MTDFHVGAERGHDKKTFLSTPTEVDSGVPLPSPPLC